MGRGRNPQFFKIIFRSVLEDCKLRFPSMFMKKYGQYLSSCGSVYLQVPGGCFWEVKLMKYKGHLWLHEGWQEFVDYYSIAYGHFLIFSFQGNSLFRVIICDISASEIRYPVDVITTSRSDHIGLDEEMDCQAPEMNGFPQKLKETRVEVEERYVQPATVSAKKRSKLDQCELPEGMGSKRCRMAGETFHSKTFDAKDRALLRAEALKCNGPSFIVPLQASHISDRFRGHIPAPHFREYLAGKYDHVVLMGQELEMRTWLVKCYSHPSSPKFTTGWKEFALDNHLVLGDVCVFELIKENSYKVFIFRAVMEGRQCHNSGHGENGAMNDRILQSVRVEDGYVQSATIKAKKRSNLEPFGLPQGIQSKRSGNAGKGTTNVPEERSHSSTPGKKNRALRSAEALRCKGPSFIVQMRPSCVSDKSRVHIPNHFREYLAEKNDNVVLMVQGVEMKTWLVKCNVYQRSSELTMGWKEFVLDNHLVVGDVCVFELVKTRTYKVFIFRAAPQEGSPTFRVIMPPSYVEGRQSRMYVPLHFHKYFPTEKGKKVVSLIRGTEGKSWQVSCYLRGKNLRFGLGWSSFARDNHIKVGDACVFELMDGMWNSFKVTVFRDSEEA